MKRRSFLAAIGALVAAPKDALAITKPCLPRLTGRVGGYEVDSYVTSIQTEIDISLVTIDSLRLVSPSEAKACVRYDEQMFCLRIELVGGATVHVSSAIIEADSSGYKIRGGADAFLHLEFPDHGC